MKKTLLTVPFLFLAPLAHADLKEVGYTLGPERFRDGDMIELKEVKASSSKLEVGDTVQVRGTYELTSHPAAKISIFVTQTDGDGRSQILPEQQVKVHEGSGEFELSIDIRNKGHLHVTFYPVEGGRGFGGVYFGKARAMKEIEHWTLDWYLGGEIPEWRTDQVH